jgi:hypothetical protein
MLQEADIEKFVYIVVVKVQLLQMLESLDALNFV